MTVTTWTCRCKQAQLRLREIRMYAQPNGTENPKWIYYCPAPGCGEEAVAAPMKGSTGPGDGAPLFSWLAPAGEDDSDLGGRVATEAERARLGDILADSTSRDHDGRRVVWQ